MKRLVVFTFTNHYYCLCTCFMLMPNRLQVILSRLCEKLEQAMQSKEDEKKNMKDSFLVDSQWIRKQWWSRGCSCVKTSGCGLSQQWILRSRLQLALNYVSAHSSPVILWIAILGCSLWSRRMAAECWQRAVAYNLYLPIGSVCSSRRRKGAEAAGGVRGSSLFGEKIGQSCRELLARAWSLKFDIGLIGPNPSPFLCLSSSKVFAG